MTLKFSLQNAKEKRHKAFSGQQIVYRPRRIHYCIFVFASEQVIHLAKTIAASNPSDLPTERAIGGSDRPKRHIAASAGTETPAESDTKAPAGFWTTC